MMQPQSEGYHFPPIFKYGRKTIHSANGFFNVNRSIVRVESGQF